jgi:hypothetical protein
VKHCGRNAFAHLRNAWALRNIDPSMAAFRAITAEEEAASALMFSLQRKQYPNASKLLPRNHNHKASITPFLQSISAKLADANVPAPNVFLAEGEEKPRVHIQIDIHALSGMTDLPHFAEPDPPLHFSIADQHGVADLAKDFARFAAERDGAAVKKYIDEEANLRNKILYASDTGIPNIQIKDEFITRRMNNVVTILTIVIMVEQTNLHQDFVCQCLDALLRIHERIERSGFEPTQSPSDQPCLSIDRTSDMTRVQVGSKGQTSTAFIQMTTDFRYQWLQVWKI